VKVNIPADFAMPPGGLNIRWPDGILEQEARILDYKVYAALAYARANGLDRLVWDSPRARLGIVTTGKSFGDVMRALADLGISEEVARHIGLRVYKVALSWPLEPQGARRFAEGLEEILVVEEKRQVIEYQIKEELYNWKEGVRAPRVVGKFDDSGEWSRRGGQPDRRLHGRLHPGVSDRLLGHLRRQGPGLSGVGDDDRRVAAPVELRPRRLGQQPVGSRRRDGVGAERLVEARQALGQLGRVGEELVEGQGFDLRRLGDDQRGEEARLGPPAPEEQTGPGPGGCGHRDQRSPTAA